MDWENAAPIITALTPVLLFLLSVFLRTADQRAEGRRSGGVVTQAGAEVQPTTRELALLQDIEQERKIAQLEERCRSLEAEKERLLGTIQRRDAKISLLNETIRVMRENNN